VAKGEGCATCNDSGFKGRRSISEVIEVSDAIEKLILKNASPKELEDQARKEGMITLFEDGMIKVSAHETTIEEVLRVMHN